MKIANRSYAVALMLPGLLLLPVICSAEIYGWIDGAGVVTYSNLPPPRGADVTQVIHEDPVAPKVQAEAAREAQAAALNDRMRLLEWEVARRQQEVVNYPIAPAAAPSGGDCGPNDYDCVAAWWPLYGGLWPYNNRRNNHGLYTRPGERRGPIAPTRFSGVTAASQGGGRGR